jgi:hypothetical protein
VTGGLLAPLSPQEEIALRRIAHGSFVVDAGAASKLVSLGLIQRMRSGLRLTPLGRLRFNALPKAPLLARQRSIHAMTGYVEGLIEKAQIRTAVQGAAAARPTAPAHVRISAPASMLPEADDAEGGPDELPIHRPIYFFFDGEHWKSCAERALACTRRAIMEHRRCQVRLCDASDRRIESSRSLLKASVPVRPSWLDAGK